MRVFVVGTGRCGTKSFAVACSHITNYTSAHETVCPSLNFPDWHIESSPPLSCCLHKIVSRYPSSFFVHLWRDKTECVPSLVRCCHGEIMRCFRGTYSQVVSDDGLLDAAGKYYDFVNHSIESTLSIGVNQSRVMKIRLSEVAEEWPRFWRKIGATGDYHASLESWKTPVNTGEERGEK